MEFKKAERKAVKLKLAISGPSGSGKTYSALKIAKGLGGRIAVIDTENGSASLYAGMDGTPTFDTLELAAPYTADRYMKAIDAALNGKYEVLIIDSISHQWAGEGGMIDASNKAKIADPKASSFNQWAKLTPEHEKFKQAILQCDVHVIATMRSKTEYAMVVNDRGKTVPQKLGMAPVQREGMEYEFTVMFDMDDRHLATTSKDRTQLFGGDPFYPTEKTGILIRDWLLSGKHMPSKDQLAELWKYKKEPEILNVISSYMAEKGLKGSTDLDIVQYEELIKKINDYKEPFKEKAAEASVKSLPPELETPWEMNDSVHLGDPSIHAYLGNEKDVK